jgi:hypothetical protein
MLQPDAAEIQSHVRVESLLAEANQERLAQLARAAEPRRERRDLRARLAGLLYAAALWLDPPLALLDARPPAPNNPCLKG